MLNHTVTKNEFTPPFSLSCVLVIDMIQEVMAEQLFVRIQIHTFFSEIKNITGYSYKINCWMLNQFGIMKFQNFKQLVNILIK